MHRKIVLEIKRLFLQDSVSDSASGHAAMQSVKPNLSMGTAKASARVTAPDIEYESHPPTSTLIMVSLGKGLSFFIFKIQSISTIDTTIALSPLIIIIIIGFILSNGTGRQKRMFQNETNFFAPFLAPEPWNGYTFYKLWKGLRYAMMKPFGEKLRRLRIEKGLSQQQLADRLHVKRSSLANWEAGRRLPDAAMISQIAKVLGVDTAILFSATENPRYLQSSFTAIVKEGTIPFTEELEHTRAYLAVEQARYHGQLFVEFDTPNTFFRIPALTLQPIVENAVKHGVDPDLEPLYISITTEDTDRGVLITVEDTGPGYASSDKDAPHFALDNIRERLKTMCGGTLDIELREVGGTKVTIIVPQSDS